MRWWLTLSFAVMFSGTFLFSSRIGLLNVLDILFFLPGLTLLTRALVSGDHKVMSSALLFPLYGFLAWALLSMGWAENANSSRTVRGVVEILILVGLLRWLHLYFRHTLKQALANGAISAIIVATAVMVSYYTTQPLSSPLFSEPANLIFRLPLLDPTVALMAMVAPTFILLAQGLEEGANGKGARRLFGAAVGLVFMCLTSLPLGAMATLLALTWLAARTRRAGLALVPLLAALYCAHLGSNDLALDSYFTHPLIGNGLNQETLNNVVAQQDNTLITLAHPRNLYVMLFHALGIIGLLLFLASWLTPLLSAVKSRLNWREDAAYTIAVLPGLLMVYASGAFLLTPFHASWLCLWLPLALMLARLCENPALKR